jgi:putative hemolysin
MVTLHEAYVIIALICVMASAFLSGSETAFIWLQKIRIRYMNRQGDEEASRMAKILEKPEKFLSTVFLGNLLVNTAMAAGITALMLSKWNGSERIAVLLSTVMVTIVLFAFSEFVRRIVAEQQSEKLALVFVTPVSLLSWVLAPAAAIPGWIGTSFNKLIGGTPTQRTLVTAEEIRTMITVGKEEGVVAEAQAKMLHKVFEFGDYPVREAMIPRLDVVWVEKGTTLADFLTVYSEHPHTRFPVYEENLDNVVGVLSIKDVLLAQANREVYEKTTINRLTRPVVVAPDTKRIGSLFTEMQEEGTQMAVVVDKHGAVEGIVTQSLLLAQLAGRFGDEFSTETQDFQTVDEQTDDIDASMRIEAVNEELGLSLPSGDYETIAGLVLNQLGHVPKQGELFRYQGLKFIVKEMTGLKIERVRIVRERK